MAISLIFSLGSSPARLAVPLGAAAAAAQKRREEKTKGEEETETTSLKEVIIDKDAYNALTDVDRKRITKYDIEFKKNEANRRIKIIDRQYVENILKEAQTKLYR